MFKFFKRAFTLGEITMILLIIGVIIVATLMAVKPSEKGIERLYYRAYTTLNTAAYNVTLRGFLPQTQAELCQELIFYINTSKINSSDAQCNNNSTPLSATTFNDTNLQFIGSNGMRFYISPLVNYTYTYNSESTTVPFRVIFVDLNGSVGVNRATYSGNNLPDIVGFAMMNDGTVVPMGLPQIDKRFLTARVHYPDDEEHGEEDVYSNRMSFIDAMNKAWGPGINPAQPFTFKFAQSADVPAGSPLKVSSYPPAPAVDTAKGCISGPDSECTIKIEEF